MATNQRAPGTNSPPKAGVRLRTIGVLVLLLGLAGAGLVYWTGAPEEDLSDDVSIAETSKKAARDIELNFGKMGLLMNDLSEVLKRPGVRAVMVLAGSTLAASGCFYLARLQARWKESGHPDV